MRMLWLVLLVISLVSHGMAGTDGYSMECCEDDVASQVSQSTGCCDGDSPEAAATCATLEMDSHDLTTECAAGCDGACVACSCCGVPFTPYPETGSSWSLLHEGQRLNGPATPDLIAPFVGEIPHVPRPTLG